MPRSITSRKKTRGSKPESPIVSLTSRRIWRFPMQPKLRNFSRCSRQRNTHSKSAIWDSATMEWRIRKWLITTRCRHISSRQCNVCLSFLWTSQDRTILERGALTKVFQLWEMWFLSKCGRTNSSTQIRTLLTNNYSLHRCSTQSCLKTFAF